MKNAIYLQIDHPACKYFIFASTIFDSQGNHEFGLLSDDNWSIRLMRNGAFRIYHYDDIKHEHNFKESFRNLAEAKKECRRLARNYFKSAKQIEKDEIALCASMRAEILSR